MRPIEIGNYWRAIAGADWGALGTGLLDNGTLLLAGLLALWLARPAGGWSRGWEPSPLPMDTW